MKTTILIEDKIYQQLVNRAIEEHGSAKNISVTLNTILKKKFTPTESLFGKLKKFDIGDLREKSDRPI